MKRFLTLLAEASLALSLGAADGVWTNQVNNSVWTNPGNWTDRSGAAIAEPPTNAVDTAMFPAPEGLGTTWFAPRSVYAFGTLLADLRDFSGGPVTGTINHAIYFPGRPTDMTDDRTWPRTLTVGDASDFKGFWYAKTARNTLVVDTPANGTSSISLVNPDSRFAIEVPNAGARVDLDTVFGSGALDVRGEGSLSIGNVADGAMTRIYAQAGTVELVGVEDDGQDGIIPGAALHLDASVTNTIETYEQDGLTCISKWKDVDGGPVCAVESDYVGKSDSYISRAHAPFVSPFKSPSGLPYVDFGSSNYKWGTTVDYPTYGPTNCLMDLSEKLTGVQEAFYVGVYTLPSRVGGTPVFGDFDFYPGNSRSMLHQTSSSQYLRDGLTMVNGHEVPWSSFIMTDRFTAGWDSPHLVGYSTLGKGSVSIFRLASFGCVKNQTGGMRIGEIVVYTNALTAVQRKKVSRYLMHKWFKDAGEAEVGGVVLHNGTSISVPSGCVARVTSLTVNGDTLVKKGAGRLEIDALNPPQVKLDIREGAVSYAASAPDLTGAKPAASPYLHLDADDLQKMTVSNVVGDTTKYIVKWPDHNGASTFAQIPAELTRLPPAYVPNAQNGHAVLDFGSRNKGTQTWMKFSAYGSDKAYEAFMAFRVTESSNGNIFGCSNRHFLRNGTGDYVFDGTYCGDAAATALWSVDGKTVDPFALGTAALGTDFHVISFSASKPCRFDALTSDRGIANSCGNQCIGEVIVYDRKLTAEERRNTHAYLMKKWLGKDHPESAAARAERAGLSYSRTALSKTGSGTAKVELTGLPELKEVVVSGGTLKSSDDNLFATACYHLDAMNTDSMKLETQGDVTNVAEWADSHANGVVFTNVVGYRNGMVVAKPRLVSVAGADGVSRPALDFGHLYNDSTARPNPNSDTAGLYSSQGLSASVAEAHIIYADHYSQKQHIFPSANSYCYRPYNSTAADPLEAVGQICRNGVKVSTYSYSKAVAGGYIAVDGVETNCYATLGTVTDGTDFHLVSIAPTSKISVEFAGMQNAGAGGCRISEQVAFPKALTASQRDYVQKHLMTKWFGASADRAICSLDRISLVGAGVFDMAGDAVAAATIGGYGSVKAALLAGVETVEWTIGDGPLTVDADVEMADVMTLRIRGDGVKPVPGTYPILRVSGRTLPAVWTVSVDEGVRGHCTYDCIVTGDLLSVRICGPGMLLIVR